MSMGVDVGYGAGIALTPALSPMGRGRKPAQYSISSTIGPLALWGEG